MFERLLAASRGMTPSVAGSLPGLTEAVVQAIPDTVTLWDLRRLLLEPWDTTTVFTAVYAVLTRRVREAEFSDREKVEIRDLTTRIGGMMEPICSIAAFDEDDPTNYASLSLNGLLALHILTLLKAPRFPPRTLISITAFTNPNDPWSSPVSASLAHALLTTYFQTHASPRSPQQALLCFPRHVPPNYNEQIPKTEKTRFITRDILTGFLRPIFAKARAKNVTESGRPAAFPEPTPRYAQGEETATVEELAALKPWKYTLRYAVTVFQWAVENADTSLLQHDWPFYTPILLTLLDEPEPVSLKLTSLSIFRAFWARCPEDLLVKTGLVEVFEQAIFPTVLSLPNLTPETDSLALLGAAYPALFDMAGITTVDANDDRSKAESMESSGFTDSQRKLIDKIFREGIMVGYHHAKEHIRLVDFFCVTLRQFLCGAGILSVKYLKDLIPMLTETLTDPFGTKYPPALLSAIQLLQAVLQTCWPRIPHHKNEIIKIAMIAWLNIEEEDDFPLNIGDPTPEELKARLIRTMETLAAIMTANVVDLTSEISLLVSKNQQLRPLFAIFEIK